MTRYTRLEILVGFFLTVGVLALAYLSISVAGVSPFQGEGMVLSARFSEVGSLKRGDPVKIAGVRLGSVEEIRLVDFEAEVELGLPAGSRIPTDSIASIQSAGLLGDSYLSISPGAADDDLPSGARISRTQPAVSLTDLLAKYAFGSPTDESEAPSTPGPTADPTMVIAPSSSAPGSVPSAPTSAKKKSVWKDPLDFE